MSDPANSSRRSATFSTYSQVTSALQGGCESNPDELALPGLALRTPEPDRTPEIVWEASSDVEAAVPSSAIFGGLLTVDSRFACSLPCPVTSIK